MKFLTKVAFIFFVVAFSNNASAQVFDENFGLENNNSLQTEQPKLKNSTANKSSTKEQKNDGFRRLGRTIEQPKPAVATPTGDTEKEAASKEYSTKASLPKTNTNNQAAKPQQPVTAPQKRIPPNVTRMRITEDGEFVFEEEEYIYLYYTNFKIQHTASGEPRCDIRFVLFTSLTTTLSDISLRVSWPKLDTGLQFVNVKPGQKYYYDYGFYGDKCYSMSKLPNITINRCRIKGRTQRDCASMFRLLQRGKL